MKHFGKKIIPLLSLSTLAFLLGSNQSAISGYSNAVKNKSNLSNNYTVDYQSKEEEQQASKRFAAQLAADSRVLLKNKNQALPLTGAKKLSVFGKRGQDPVYNGSGSGGISGISVTSLYDGLQNSGFSLNPKLTSLYAGASKTGNIKTGSSGQSGETIEIDFNDTNYSGEVISSYASYNDAAIIVIGRGGGEGGDLKRANVDGHTDVTEHSLELNDNEKALLAHVKAQKEAGVFNKIIYLVNTAAAFQLAPLEDDDAIDAILWIGRPGANGRDAVGQILKGDVNPSGKTSAIYPANFKQDPTWYNFGNQNQIYGADNGGTKDAYGDSYNGTPYTRRGSNTSNYLKTDSANPGRGAAGITDDSGLSWFRSIDYSEGIYRGYRWYETAKNINGYYVSSLPTGEKLPSGVTKVRPDGQNDLYYNRYNGVLYPFGYGLSYTSFSWEVGQPSITTLAADSKVEIKVTVRNDGTVAGKDVVELYSDPQYTDGGIEKASANLIAYAKTKTLAPGTSETLTLSFDAKDLADFDYNDANKNGFKGYELEAGKYKINVGRNSHEYAKTLELNVDNGIKYDGSTDALNYNNGYGKNSDAVFSQDDKYNTIRDRFRENDSDKMNQVSRATGKWQLPKATKANRLKFKTDLFDIRLGDIYNGGADFDKPTDPWYKSSVPSSWTQAAGTPTASTTIQLSELRGLAFNDPKWDTFRNQLTYNERVGLISNGSYSTAALDRAGKPRTTDADGPTQIGSGATSWPCKSLQASSFNDEMGYQIGHFVGQDSILNDRTGWYGPGFNTNRSPFGGRNFEYYSQDGFLSGSFGSNVVKGATDLGVIVYAKHRALNDQESYRYSCGGVSTWVSEQALRQIYLKGWERSVKHGNLNAARTSYSKVGGVHASSNWMMNQELRVNEWGFEGHIVTDRHGSNASNRWAQGTSGDRAARVGVIPLGSYVGGKTINGEWDEASKQVLVPKTLEIKDWIVTSTADNNNACYTATVTRSSEKVASPTQWYWVRNTAQRVLFTVGNSHQREGNNIYHIVFDENYSGGKTTARDVQGGNDFQVPENPVRAGYEFNGWFYDKACTLPATIDLTPGRNRTYYAGWVPGDGALTVTYNENYYGAPEETTYITPFGNVANSYVPVREGYDFGGWYTTPDCREGTKADTSLPVYQNYTLYAKWTIKTFTITFDVAGGEGGNIIEKYNYGEALTLPSPTREGYIFAGWSYSYRVGWSRVTGTIISGGKVTESATYTALWIAEGTTSFDVRFNQNYDGANVDTVKATSGSRINTPRNPSRTGYVFKGWNTAADGSGEDFDANAAINANVTYYAIWEVATLKVSIDENYDDGKSSEFEISYGSTIDSIENLPEPTRPGYTFAGWYLDEDCRIVANRARPLDSDVTLYAKWVINEYDVTFDYGDSKMEQKAEYGSSVNKPEDPTRDGYLFDGWYTNSDYSGHAVDPSAVTITEDTVFYAKWIENTANITFDNNDGSGKTSVTKVNNGEVVTAPTPTREGYTFGGWYYDAACTQEANLDDPQAGDATYYAKWIENASAEQKKESNSGLFAANIASIVVSSVSALFVLGLVLLRKKKEHKQK